MEELETKATMLEEQNTMLKMEIEALRKELNASSDLSEWVPYVKLFFSWTVTALIIFIVAERQYMSGYKVSFGVLSALGGSCIFLAIPATHFVGQRIHDGYSFFQPFQGGTRFVILQAISWTFYSLTALMVMASVAYAEQTHGLLLSGGVVGILAQVFMVSSLLTYDKKKGACGKKKESMFKVASSIVDSSFHHGTDFKKLSQDEFKDIGQQFIAMNTALIVIGMVLAFVSEHTQNLQYRATYTGLSLVCCTVAIFLTYGLGGRVSNKKLGWSFVQAFQGGKEFVYYQAFGWILFGIAIVAQGAFFMSSIYIGTHLQGTMYVGGLAAMLAQYVLVTSLRKYQAEKVSPLNYRKLEDLSWGPFFISLASVTFFCNMQFVSFGAYMLMLCLPYMLPQFLLPYISVVTLGLIPDIPGTDQDFSHTFYIWFQLFATIVTWTLTFAAYKTFGAKGWRLSVALSISSVAAYGGFLSFNRMSPHYPMLVLIISLNLVYISTTYTKEPETNACREWPAFKHAAWLSNALEYFFGARIVVTDEMKECGVKLGNHQCEEEKYHQLILLFHPHGIFPVTSAWISSSRMWKDLFPYLEVNCLSATVMHYVPVMRDVLQWFGVCDVSKDSISNMLGMNRNIQIVCGGQTEMFESRSWDTDIRVVRKRRTGIFKIAIQNGLGIVPMYSFGETQLFDNVYMPSIQTWFKNHLGFPFPFLMLGKFGLPIPRRVPVTLAMDAPVFPVKKNPTPSKEEISEFQTRYFAVLEKLFDKFKDQNGHEDFKLDWIDK